jgi:hypothetical protein
MQELYSMYSFIGISNPLQTAQAEVVLGQRSMYLASWIQPMWLAATFLKKPEVRKYIAGSHLRLYSETCHGCKSLGFVQKSKQNSQ